jgi:dienelactone hydrolase
MYFRTQFLAAIVALWLTVTQALWAQNPQATGSYATATRDTSFDDATTWNLGSINVRVHYPTDTGTFPVIAFGHGFQIAYTAYDQFCAHLASWGYIVVNVNEQNNPFNISHQTFARQMASAIQFMQAEGQRPASRYFGRVGSTSGAVGHSMGGGASMLIPGQYSGITAVAGMAPAETNPSAIAALANIETPLFIIAGKGDSVTPALTVQQPMYNAVAGPRTLHTLKNGGHCAFTDASNAICNIGAASTQDAGTLSNAVQQGRARRYVTAFFNVYLQGLEDYRVYLCGDSAQQDTALSSVQTNEDCSPPSATAEAAPTAQHLTASYEMATGQLRVVGQGAFEVVDATGRVLAYGSASPSGVWVPLAGAQGPRLLFVRSRLTGIAVRASVR